MSTMSGFDRAKVAAYAQVMTLALAMACSFQGPHLPRSPCQLQG